MGKANIYLRKLESGMDKNGLAEWGKQQREIHHSRFALLTYAPNWLG